MTYLLGLLVLMVCTAGFGYYKMHQISNYESGYGLMFFAGTIISFIVFIAILFTISWKLVLGSLLLVGILLFLARLGTYREQTDHSETP